MYYILGGAYKALLFALYLKNVLGKKITIITYNKDIIQYCINENIDCISFERMRPRVLSIYKLFKLKKILNNILNEIDVSKENKFFLTSNASAYDSFYLAKKLSKKGIVYFKYVDKNFKNYEPPRYKPIFIRGGILRIALKLIFNLDTMYYETNGVPRIGIDEKFLNKNNIREFKPSIKSDQMILDAIKKSKVNYKEYDNLIVDDGLAVINSIRYTSVNKIYKDIFKLPIEFAFKKHPKPMLEENKAYQNFYKIFSNCKEIPRYMPVELFYNNIHKNVISIFSAALIGTSQFEHIKAISLIELVEWHNESYKKEWKEYFKKESNNKILFPNSLEELKKLLIE